MCSSSLHWGWKTSLGLEMRHVFFLRPDFLGCSVAWEGWDGLMLHLGTVNFVLQITIIKSLFPAVN